jgi:hypothetical protein
VVADGRLGEADRRRQVARADVVGGQQQRDQTDAHRIGQRLEPHGHLEGGVGVHRGGGDGRAADGLAGVDHGKGSGHRNIVATFLTYVKEVRILVAVDSTNI